jgi:glycosidase
MPKLNTANPEVKEYLLGVARKYLREFQIDGWRLDVANEIDHQFWREFRQAVKAENPQAYIVGEIWHDAMPWLRGDQYDAVMNYQYGRAVSDFILANRYAPNADAFIARIASIDFSYPLPVLRAAFNVMDSHDTDRFLTRCGEDAALARLGWVIEWMLPGSQSLYYGDEYGLSGGGDPDNRRCMPWDSAHQDQSWFEFFTQLIAFRNANWKILSFGERRYAADAQVPGLLGLSARLDGREVAAVVNRSEEKIHPQMLQSMLERLDCRGKTVHVSLSSAPFSGETGLPAKGFAILEFTN